MSLFVVFILGSVLLGTGAIHEAIQEARKLGEQLGARSA